MYIHYRVHSLPLVGNYFHIRLPMIIAERNRLSAPLGSLGTRPWSDLYVGKRG